MTDYADWTKNLIADIRANGRPTSGYFQGRPVMVLTTTGAKSGQPRTVVVSYSRDGDDYVVVGSKSGEPEDPAWFTNLVANPVVTVEADGLTFQARATVAEGADRDTLWDRHVAEHPQFADYPSKTDRIIPSPGSSRSADGGRPDLALRHSPTLPKVARPAGRNVWIITPDFVTFESSSRRVCVGPCSGNSRRPSPSKTG